MRVTTLAIIGLVSLALPSLVNAIPVQASTGIFATARECVAGPIGACFDFSPILFSDYGGRPGGLNATTSQVFSGFGTARSHTGLSGPIGARLGLALLPLANSTIASIQTVSDCSGIPMSATQPQHVNSAAH